MNDKGIPSFCPLPKEKDFSQELKAYLNKNVQDPVVPDETDLFDFSICVASFPSPLDCVAVTNNKFRGTLKVDLRRKVFKTLKNQPDKNTKIRLFF